MIVYRVNRGGCWIYSAVYARVAVRDWWERIEATFAAIEATFAAIEAA